MLPDRQPGFSTVAAIFLLVVLTLLGASGAFVRNRNIRVDYFAAKASVPTQRRLEIFGLALTVILFLMVAWYGARFVVDDWKFDTTSPGIGIPQWVYSIWLPLLALAIVGRAAGRIVRLVRAGAAR